jgi:hypothetical protein
MIKKEKSENEKAIHSLMENKIVKVGAVIAIALGGLYVLSKAFKVIGGTISSFREMTDSFRR